MHCKTVLHARRAQAVLATLFLVLNTISKTSALGSDACAALVADVLDSPLSTQDDSPSTHIFPDIADLVSCILVEDSSQESVKLPRFPDLTFSTDAPSSAFMAVAHVLRGDATVKPTALLPHATSSRGRYVACIRALSNVRVAMPCAMSDRLLVPRFPWRAHLIQTLLCSLSRCLNSS
jgi:hypothetical protein